MPCTTPGTPAAHGGAARRFDADELGGGVGEAGEDADGVRAAADAGRDHVGDAAVQQVLRTGPGPRCR